MGNTYRQQMHVVFEKVPHVLEAFFAKRGRGERFEFRFVFSHETWRDKKESVSLVWAISRRNVVIGKYLPSADARCV